MNSNRTPDDLLDQAAAAEYLGLQPRTLERWRWSGGPDGGGPPFVVLSRRAVRYRRSDLDAYIAARVRTSTSDPGPQQATG